MGLTVVEINVFVSDFQELVLLFFFIFLFKFAALVHNVILLLFLFFFLGSLHCFFVVVLNLVLSILFIDLIYSSDFLFLILCLSLRLILTGLCIDLFFDSVVNVSFLHLLLEFFKCFLVFFFFLFLLLLGLFNVDFHVVTEVVSELELLSLNRSVPLQLVQEVVSPGKLDVLHEGLRKTVADLLQVQVPQGGGDLLGIKGLTQVPSLLLLLFI